MKTRYIVLEWDIIYKDKETWKIGTDRDKIEKLIKYNMSVQYHKSIVLKKKTYSSNIKQCSFQSKTRKSKMLINCSEMTVTCTVMHCSTLHYTVEYTATHCRSDKKTRPSNVAGMWSGYCPPVSRTHCSKKVMQKTNINSE